VISFLFMPKSAAAFAYLWIFQVKPGREAEFEKLYGPNGGWAQFFRGSPQYLRTELLRDLAKPGRYCTIDYWTDEASHKEFCQQQAKQFKRLDAAGEKLTESETAVGNFEVVE